MSAAKFNPVPILPSAEVLSWLQGFADHGWRFLELYFKKDRTTGKVKKQPRRSMGHYKDMTGEKGLSFALACLEKGSPIGCYPPKGYWVFDADDSAQVAYIGDLLSERGITPLMDSTRRGGHFVFRLPDDFPMDGLKQALHLPPRDFIFGPNTYIVAPGSKWKEHDYRPATAWFPPPVLDPRAIEPDGKFWEIADTRPFLVSTESLAVRTFAVRGYLTHKAPVCIRGTGKGSKTLGKVAAHVCGYYLLSPSKATAMMRGPGSWNARLVDGSGKPAPFSRDEIFDACQAAEGKGSPYGIAQCIYEQDRLLDTARLEANIETLKAHRTMPETHWVPIADIYPLLNSGALSDTVIGDALEAHGIKRRQHGESRTMHISKVNYPAVVDAVLGAKFAAKMFMGCPLKLLDPKYQAKGGVPALLCALGEDPKEALVSHVRIQDSGERLVLSVSSLETPANAAFLPEVSQSAGYQTSLPWADDAPAKTLSPASAYLPKLAEMASSDLLVAMSTDCPAAIRDKAIARFWPGQKAAKVSIRVMRHACRKSGLVADDGALTPAGMLALGLAP